MFSRLLTFVPLEAFKEEPFVLTHKASTIRELTDSLFKEAGFEPQILFETANNNTIIEMVRAGICCGIVPAYYTGQPDESITYFSLPSNPSWDLIAAHRKGLYISNAAKDFIALGAEYFTAFYHNYS